MKHWTSNHLSPWWTVRNMNTRRFAIAMIDYIEGLPTSNWRWTETQKVISKRDTCKCGMISHTNLFKVPGTGCKYWKKRSVSYRFSLEPIHWKVMSFCIIFAQVDWSPRFLISRLPFTLCGSLVRRSGLRQRCNLHLFTNKTSMKG